MRTLATAAVAAVALVSVVGASADASGSSHELTLRFLDKVNPSANSDIDLGAPGLSAGDEQVFLDSLYQGGKKVGTTAGFGKIVSASSTTINGLVVATVNLPTGHLTMQSAFHEVLANGPAKTLPTAITGGTGAYRGASGQCTSTTINGSDDSNIVCHVTLPYRSPGVLGPLA
jgi:hypothetical protein